MQERGGMWGPVYYITLGQVLVDTLILISDFLKLHYAEYSLFIMWQFKFNEWLSICYSVSHSTHERQPFILTAGCTM